MNLKSKSEFGNGHPSSPKMPDWQAHCFGRCFCKSSTISFKSHTTSQWCGLCCAPRTVRATLQNVVACCNQRVDARRACVAGRARGALCLQKVSFGERWNPMMKLCKRLPMVKVLMFSMFNNATNGNCLLIRETILMERYHDNKFTIPLTDCK